MKLKTLQWNIGGGKIRKGDANPLPDIGSVDNSYIHDGLDYIISKIKEYNADIVTLQETHANKLLIQAKIIAKNAGYQYWTNNDYNDSHVESGQRICQSILSKYPISNETFELFNNPRFEVMAEDGSTWISHDKGYSQATVKLPENKYLTVGTLHLVPFRRFNKEYTDPRVQKVLNDVDNKVTKNVGELSIIQGDFNIDRESLIAYFPKLFNLYKEIEVKEPTTPRGRKYDHVLYRGITLVKNETFNNVLTDHYLMVSEFELS